MTTVTVSNFDICLPCYVERYADEKHEIVGVPIDNETTISQVMDALEEEWKRTDVPDYIWEAGLHGLRDLEKTIDPAKLDTPLDRSLEPCDPDNDECEWVYAWFEFVIGE